MVCLGAAFLALANGTFVSCAGSLFRCLFIHNSPTSWKCRVRSHVVSRCAAARLSRALSRSFLTRRLTQCAFQMNRDRCYETRDSISLLSCWRCGCSLVFVMAIYRSGVRPSSVSGALALSVVACVGFTTKKSWHTVGIVNVYRSLLRNAGELSSSFRVRGTWRFRGVRAGLFRGGRGTIGGLVDGSRSRVRGRAFRRLRSPLCSLLSRRWRRGFRL